MPHNLDDFDMSPCWLEREWVLTIDTPAGGAEPVMQALGPQAAADTGALRQLHVCA